MKKLRLEVSASLAVGLGVIVLGIFTLIIGITSNEIDIIVRGCAFIALGAANSALGIERLLNFKLRKIHEWFGPYEAKKSNLFEVQGGIFSFLGACAYIGGTIILTLTVFGKFQIQNSDVGIGLLAIGLAFSSLGRMHFDNRKYDDIAEGIHRLVTRTDEISKDISMIEDKLDREVDKVNENSEPDHTPNTES